MLVAHTLTRSAQPLRYIAVQPRPALFAVAARPLLLPLASGLTTKAKAAAAAPPAKKRSTAAKASAAATKPKKVEAKQAAPGKRATKKEPEIPKVTVLKFPPVGMRPINVFHRAMVEAKRPADMASAQELMKEVAAQWKSLSAEEKAPYEEAAEKDRARYLKEIEALRSSLGEEDIARERKVQKWRQSQGKAVSQQSRYVTRADRSATLNPYAAFVKNVYAMPPERAASVVGEVWEGADFKAKSVLLSSAWKALSPAEKAEYIK